MAETRGVWGIDIGQAGLKAIRLKYAEAADQVLAVAFDYVPHPKILSQPDAIPEELIAQALEKFLSRNDLKGDAVVISVPGQTALARFIQLPPVEASKVGDIVKYEARQQIPFALEDVIWDYQTLGGGTEESGFMLEAETERTIRDRAAAVLEAAPERRRDELMRIFALDDAFAGVRLLDRVGLLDVLLPEVTFGRGVSQPGGFHAYDVFEHNLRCVEAKTGKILWEKKDVGKYHAALVRTGDGKLLMLEDNGGLCLFQPDPKEYKELAKAKVCGPTWAHPAVSGGHVFLRDEKELIALEVGK